MLPTRRDRRGISILEVLIGLAVFATAFLMCLGVFPTAARAVTQARSQAQATRLAEAELERLMGLPFVDVASGLRTEVGQATVAGRSVPVSFTVQTTVTDVDTDLKDLHVLVSWSSDSTHYVRLETYRANRD